MEEYDVKNALKDIEKNFVIIFSVAIVIFLWHIIFFIKISPPYYLDIFIPFMLIVYIFRFIWVLIREQL